MRQVSTPGKTAARVQNPHPGASVAIVRARWNDEITRALARGALEAALAEGAKVEEFEVAGSFELPPAVATIARSGRFDAVVPLGCLIRGETAHFDVLAHAVARSLAELAASLPVAIPFGVLTCETIEQARAELARRGLELDEKAVGRIAHELGAQMLTTRTRDLMRFRAGELPAGTEFAGKRVAVEIDGGRVRVRTVIKTIWVGGKRKRKPFRVEWREPKVVILFETDEKGRMVRGSRPVIDGTLQGPDVLIELVAFHLHRLGGAQAKVVTFAADGAPWIWARLDWVIQPCVDCSLCTSFDSLTASPSAS